MKSTFSSECDVEHWLPLPPLLQFWAELFESWLTLTLEQKLTEVSIFLPQIIFSLLMFCAFFISLKFKTEGQKLLTENLTENVQKMKSKFSLILG